MKYILKLIRINDKKIFYKCDINFYSGYSINRIPVFLNLNIAKLLRNKDILYFNTDNPNNYYSKISIHE